MVGGRRAAAKGELGEADFGGGPFPVGIDRCPDGIALAQPIEEAAILGADPGEGLVEVVMGIDQPRKCDQAATVDDVGLLANRWASLADPADDATVDQDRSVLEFGAGVVHRHDHAAALDQDHFPSPIREAARLTASRIFWYPVQPQRLPLSASRIVAGLGLGSFCSRSATATTNPGVQNPHYAAPASTRASWIGCKRSSAIRPSTVRTSRSCACAASTRQLQTSVPSSQTEHDPHPPCSQAFFEP